MMTIQLSEDHISLTEHHRQIIAGLHSLSRQIKKVLEADESPQQLTTTVLANSHLLLILGHGLRYATCLEGVLKIKEISHMHSEGILAGELKRGPLALIDENTPVAIIVTRDSLYPQGQERVRADHRARGAAEDHPTVQRGRRVCAQGREDDPRAEYG